MKKNHIEPKIKSLSQREYIQLCVFDQMEIDYLILIYSFILNPPISRRTMDDSISIHRFFVNEFETATTFKIICKKLVKQLNLMDDVGLNQFETGHSEVTSKSLTTYFKEINFDDSMSLFNPTNYFSDDTYKTITDQQKLSFLLGKYIRFYRENKFIFIDSWETYIIMDMLKSFCISQDNLRSESFFGVPGAVHFILNEDSILLEYLNRWAEELKVE